VVLRALVVALYLRARRHVPLARPLIDRYAAGYGAAVVIWLASLVVPTPWRYVVWGLALAFEYSIPVLAQHLHTRIPINPSHVRERLALFTMIVLGESVVTIALGAQDEHWNTREALTATCGFLLVACLWWVYFDGGVEEQLGGRRHAAELYTRLHVPLLLSLTAVGAGVHLLIEPSGAGAAWAFDGGAALYLLCVTLAQSLTCSGLRAGVRGARLICVALLVLCASQAAALDRVGLAALSAAALTTLVVYEITASHRGAAGEPGEVG
jgi:low temperature requirement protein LtrA